MPCPAAPAGALLVALLLASTSAWGDPPRIYKWVDGNGIAHYTTDPEQIPRNLRPSFLSLGRPGEAAPRRPSEEALLPAPGSDSWAAREAGPVAPPTLGEPPADGTAPESSPRPAASPGPALAARDAHAQRIRELEAAIARDEEALKELISRESTGDAPVPADDRALREIALRLPGLQADLRALRAERTQSETP